MRILFRTRSDRRNDQRNEHRCEQSPRPRSSVNPTSPWAPRRSVSNATPPTANRTEDFLRRGAARCARFSSPRSPRRSVSGATPPAKNPADHSLSSGAECRRSSALDCVRFHLADQRHSLAECRSITASLLACPERFARRVATLLTETGSQTELAVSYTKQGTDLVLTGTRTAHSHLQFAPQSDNRRLLAASHSPLATVISNRELLVLGTPQLIENTRRPPVLIENFEPNSLPAFRAFAAVVFLHAPANATRPAFPPIESPRSCSDDQRAA
jgi:hypothetical protein